MKRIDAALIVGVCLIGGTLIFLGWAVVTAFPYIATAVSAALD